MAVDSSDDGFKSYTPDDLIVTVSDNTNNDNVGEEPIWIRPITLPESNSNVVPTTVTKTTWSYTVKELPDDEYTFTETYHQAMKAIQKAANNWLKIYPGINWDMNEKIQPKSGPWNYPSCPVMIRYVPLNLGTMLLNCANAPNMKWIYDRNSILPICNVPNRQ